MGARPSNLALRLATAAVGVPIILGTNYFAPPWAFYIIVLGASLVGAQELFAMTHQHDRVSQWAGILLSAAASVIVFVRYDDPDALLAVLVGVPLGGLLVTLARLGAIETAAQRAFALGVGPLLVAVPLTLLAVVRRASGVAAAGLVVLALGLAWFTDTGAYFAGRFAGRHRLYEAVSPKKTVEGGIGGLLAGVVWAILGSVGYLRGELPLSHAVVLGVVGGALGQAGDLGESLLKRSTGVKDSGKIVPGHGGVLDRVDALIMTTVVVFFYARWVRR
ncbi:MAG TPA: phosphatidate cytidylyltransferase [Polyangiaceae bacterium]|nr:phosphatidate cytidylyltransferase [Polyangiaceae bacterium]